MTIGRSTVKKRKSIFIFWFRIRPSFDQNWKGFYMTEPRGPKNSVHAKFILENDFQELFLNIIENLGVYRSSDLNQGF